MTPNPYCQVKGFLPAWEEAAGSPLGPLRVSHLPPLQEEAVVPTLQDAWISTQHRVAGDPQALPLVLERTGQLKDQASLWTKAVQFESQLCYSPLHDLG